jgi:cyclin B
MAMRSQRMAAENALPRYGKNEAVLTSQVRTKRPLTDLTNVVDRPALQGVVGKPLPHTRDVSRPPPIPVCGTRKGQDERRDARFGEPPACSLTRVCSRHSLTSTTSAVSASPVIVEDSANVSSSEPRLDAARLAPEKDPQLVLEYACEIVNHMRNAQVGFMPQGPDNGDYMSNVQTDVNEKMRSILVDWLVEVHLKFKLEPETLYLTVNLLDRYLSLVSVPRAKLQLIGVTCMFVAAKYEEIEPPVADDFVYITDRAFSRSEIMEAEVSLLNSLEFKVCVATPYRFLQQYAKVQGCTAKAFHMAQYFLELTLPEYGMTSYCPSELSCAALFLTNKVFKQHPSWQPALVDQTNMAESEIKGAARKLCGILQHAEARSLQAVRKKFASPAFSSVSKIIVK